MPVPGFIFFVKHIFINPISYTLGASLQAEKKQVLSTLVYLRCLQVVESEI